MTSRTWEISKILKMIWALRRLRKSLHYSAVLGYSMVLEQKAYMNKYKETKRKNLKKIPWWWLLRMIKDDDWFEEIYKKASRQRVVDYYLLFYRTSTIWILILDGTKKTCET